MREFDADGPMFLRLETQLALTLKHVDGRILFPADACVLPSPSPDEVPFKFKKLRINNASSGLIEPSPETSKKNGEPVPGTWAGSTRLHSS